MCQFCATEHAQAIRRKKFEKPYLHLHSGGFSVIFDEETTNVFFVHETIILRQNYMNVDLSYYDEEKVYSREVVSW